MRIYALLCPCLLVIVSLSAAIGLNEDGIEEVPFRQLDEPWVGATEKVPLVLRTEDGWDAAPVGSNGRTPNFTDILVLAVSHRPLKCTHEGGGSERIELVENAPRISFEAIAELPPPNRAAGHSLGK